YSHNAIALEFHVNGPRLPALFLDQVIAVCNNVFDFDLRRRLPDEREEIEQRTGVGPASVFREGFLNEVPGSRQLETDRSGDCLIWLGAHGGAGYDHQVLCGHQTLLLKSNR